MNKWILALVLGTAVMLAMPRTGTSAAAAAAQEPAQGRGEVAAHAQEEAAGPSSPLYAPNEGVITGTVTIVVFAILVAVLGKYAWAPIVSGLREREEKIRREISDAEAARNRAEETLKEYNARLATAEQQVRDLLAKAGADAERIATNLKMQAQQESEEIKERANREIDQARKNAVADIYRQAADLSTGIAEKILRRNLNSDDQRDLVNSSLEQLQTAERL